MKCKHGKLLVNPSGYLCCNECYEEFQKQEIKRWNKKQEAIRDAYPYNYNLYVSICGDPIQKENFH
jgi:uncharacterized Zn ribbon protein